MVGIVSGNSLGLGSTSLAVLGRNGLLGTAGQGRNGEQAFVNVANGNLVLQDRDDYLVAHGVNLTALRTYNSQGKLNDDNADNWSMGAYAQQVKLTGTLNAAGSTLTRTARDGSESIYTWDAARLAYVSTDGAGAYDTLKAVGSDYVWTDGDSGLTETYEAATGRLTSTADARGTTASYAYNASGFLSSMTSASGDVTYLDYVGSNVSRVRTVRADSTTLTRVAYTYDTSNRLSSVTVDLSPEDGSTADNRVYQTSYTYDGASTRVASVTQSDGTSLAFTYVQVGADYRVATVTDGLNHTTSYSYDTASQRTTVTDPLGLVTRYEYDAAGQLTKVTAPAVGGVSQVSNFAYNATGDLIQVTDALGRALVMQYDANGNQVLQRDAAGNTITRTYDARNQLLTESSYTVADPDGAGAGQPSSPLTTRYVYDAANKNLLRFVLSPAGRVTEFRYNAWGEQVSSIQYGAAAYNVAALGATAVPTEAAMATWAGSQNLALSTRSDRVLDARGQLQSVTVFAKVDASGNGVSDGSQSTTQYIYDQAGLLLKTISGTSGVNLYTYDGLGRVLSVQNALLQTTLTSYDDAGNKTTVSFANGLSTSRVYDAAGRLVSVTQSSAQTANLGTTLYFYDADNRLTMTQDPTGVRAWMLYDDAGRKTADIDGNGSLTEYVYDANNHVTQSIAYAAAVNVASLVDGAGQPLNPALASVRPATGASDIKSWRIYDSAGRLVKTVDGQGAVAEMKYDGANRLVSVTRYANLVSTAALGAAPASGSVVPTPNAGADRVQRSFYDDDGLLRASLDAEGYLTEFKYDSAGRLVGRTAYATATAQAQRASGTLAQLLPATDAKDITTRLVLNAKGQVAAEVDAEGYLTEKVYDANGNLTQSVRYATAVSAGALAAFSASTTVADLRPAASAEDRSSSATYDLLNRVATSTDAAGTVTQFTYDTAGNLTQKVSAAGTSEARTLTAKYDLQGRLVGELTGVGSALLTGGLTQAQIDLVWSQYGLAHSYDAAGRRTSTTDGYGNKTLFFYDADGHLTHTVNALGEVRESQYNALGQLSSTVTYGTRISLAGLAGGLVNTALTSAITANVLLDSKVSYTYNSYGGLASSTDALGNVTALGYNAFGDEVSRVQDLGASQTLTKTTTVDRRGLATGTVLDASGINAISSAVYDAFGRLTSSTDANNHVSSRSFDRLGRVITSLDPLNVSRGSSYDAFDRVLTQTDGLGKVTSYSYNKALRSITVTTPESISVTTVQTRLGQTQSVTDGLGNTTSFAYDLNGNLLSTTTALTTTSQSYDRNNRLASTTDANGNQVVLAYDAAGRVLTRTVDPAGLNLTTTYGYDAKGQQVTVTDPAGHVSQFSFDLKGQLTQQAIDPAGLNLVTAYSYDGRGKTLTVTDPRGTVTRYTYDKLGRRTLEQVDPTGLNLTRSYAYDKGGNVTSATDANGKLTRYAYDAGDRLVYTVDASGNVRQNGFDAQGRIVKTTVYATALAPADLAGLPAAATVAQIQAKVVAAASFDAVENRVYDKDGRLTATVNALGEVVKYTYDAAGNVIERVAYANRVAMSGGSAWVAGTLPAPVADAAHDQRMRTVYDQLGRAIFSLDSTGAVVKQTFDGNGNVLERLAYAKPVAPATAATAAAITAAVVASGNDARVRNVYDAANRLVYRADGVGAVTRFVYDASGNTVKTIQYATAVAGTAAPASVSASAADRITVFAYDKANRQTFSVDALGGVTKYIYDANGNVAQKLAYATAITPPVAATTPDADAIQASLVANATNDRVERFAYDLANRQVFRIDAGGAATETTFDAAGNAVQTRRYAALVDVSTLPAVASASAVALLVVANATNDRVEKRAFDASNRQVYGVDALGYVRKTVYDGTGAIKGVTEYATAIPAATAGTASAIAAAIVTSTANDRSSSFVYDAAGRLTGSTDALGFTESNTYNALGEKLTFTNKNGATWNYDYDAGGRLITETSPLVAVTGLQVNATTGQLEVNPALSGNASIVTRMSYDSLGNLLSRTEASGRAEERTTSYEYDAVGHQVKTIYPPVSVYNAAADNITVNGATGLATRTETLQTLSSHTSYDVFGNAVANRDVAGAMSYKAYDKLGRVRYDVDALGFVTGYARNTWGEVTTLTRYGSATTLLTGNPAQLSGTQISTALAAAGFSHSMDRILLTEYDRLGRVAKVIEPQGYAYDSTAAAGAQYFTAGKTTRNSYNAFGDLSRVALLKNAVTDTWTTTEYFYDLRGGQTAIVDAMGYLTTQAFDGAGNIVDHTEYATAIAGWNSAVTHAAAPAPVTSANDDRKITSVFDRNNRKVSDTRVNVLYSVSTASTTGVRGNAVTSYLYDAVGNTTATTDANGATTYSYYDAMGRVTAVAEPARIDVVTPGTNVVLTPLTLFRRDAYGNVVSKVQLANGAATATATAFTQGAASGADRTTLTAYDRAGHATQVTDALGYNHYSSYDAHGHIAKEWQAVTGNDGVTRTKFRAYQYDKLGRQTHVIDPASTTVLQSGLTTTFTSDTYSYVAYNESGSYMFTGAGNSATLGWSSLIDASGGLVRVQIDYQTVAVPQFVGAGENGVPVFVPGAPHAATVVQDFNAAAASGGVTLSWLNAGYSDGGISQLSTIRVWQQNASGNFVIKWQGSPAQANGSGITNVSQQQAGLVDTAVEYNAFGEVIRKGINGGREEYFDYDNAGHLWRTNSGDGIAKVSLYDLQGHQTADIRSAGSGRGNLNLLAYASADQVAGLADVRRNDVKYDELGHVTQQLQAERLTTQGGVTVRANQANAGIASASYPAYDWNGNSAGWNGSNNVYLTWSSLANLGGGDILVSMDYVTQPYTYVLGQTMVLGENGMYSPATDESGNVIGVRVPVAAAARNITRTLTADQAASGMTMSWIDSGTEGGLASVTRLQLYKKDYQGNWRLITDRSSGSFGTSGSSIELTAPADASTTLQLQLRPAGATTPVETVSLLNFGDALRYDGGSRNLAAYEYQVLTTVAGGATTSSGWLPVPVSGATAGTSQWSRPVVNQKTDRWGNVLEINDPRALGWKTTYSYNAGNQVVRQSQADTDGNQSAASPVTNIYYDRMGRQLATTDARGNSNLQEFDAAGNLVKETHADGGVVSYRYDVFGNKVQVKDTRGFVTSFNYDKLNRLLSTVRPVVSVYTVGASNSMTYVNGRAITETNTWDQAGRKLTSTNGNYETLSYSYDMLDNVVATRQPLGQTVKATFDLRGRKSAEVDANNNSATWSYDYFGQLYGHTDLGGAKFSYAYDNARQLVVQTSTRGQYLIYGYDAAGQLVRNTDAALGKVTTYAWDLGGHSVREKVVQGGVTYQDNSMAYDALGRLRWVGDTRAFINLDYDKMGNRTRIQTHVITGSGASDADRYFQYDAMNRQTVVDAVDAAGNLGSVGHRITYDGNGNRTSDTFLGTRVGSVQVVDHYNPVYGAIPVLNEYGQPTYDESGNPITTWGIVGYSPVYRTDLYGYQGTSTEVYNYDGLNRLTGVVKDGVQLDYRYYDGASRVLQTGPAGTLSTAYINALTGGASGASGSETRVNRFDANGRMLYQRVLKSDNSAKYDINYSSYDAAGNLQSYSLQNYEGTAYTNYYSYAQNRFDGYKEAAVNGTSTYFQPGTTTSYYDANGYLTAVTDSTNGAANRSFVNDASGKALYTAQNGQVQRQLIVAGEVLGRYGNAASGANVVDFNFGYQPINGNYPKSSPGTYIVAPNDTLQSIARGAYGDSSLWYRIAEANGLSGDSDLRIGQTLTIPSRVGTINNNASTFKPYDPSAMVGDTTPNLPTPPPPAQDDDGCGVIGQIIVVVITVVVSIFVPLPAIPAAMLGSFMGQVAGNALGVQDGISWEGIALAGVSAGISEGLSEFIPKEVVETLGKTGTAIVKAAAANALTQGIGVVTGLQDHFDWRGVAAAAVGTAVGLGVGDALGLPGDGPAPGMGMGEFIAKSAIKSLASGAATAIARGGRVTVQQIAMDAFGNTLGESLRGYVGQGSGPVVGQQEEQLFEAEQSVSGFGREEGYHYLGGSAVDRQEEQLVHSAQSAIGFGREEGYQYLGGPFQAASASGGLYLNNAQETRLQLGQTVTDYGDEYGDSWEATAKSIGAVRRANGKGTYVVISGLADPKDTMNTGDQKLTFDELRRQEITQLNASGTPDQGVNWATALGGGFDTSSFGDQKFTYSDVKDSLKAGVNSIINSFNGLLTSSAQSMLNSPEMTIAAGTSPHVFDAQQEAIAATPQIGVPKLDYESGKYGIGSTFEAGFDVGQAVTAGYGVAKLGVSVVQGIRVGQEVNAATSPARLKVGIDSSNTDAAVLFGNKYPEHMIDVPKIVPNERLGGISGKFNYVVNEEGSLIVGRSGHTSLTGGAPVQAAGEVQLYNGTVKWIDNASGHYQPLASIAPVAEAAFNNAGLKATGTFIPKVWVPNPVLPRGGAWVQVKN